MNKGRLLAALVGALLFFPQQTVDISHSTGQAIVGGVSELLGRSGGQDNGPQV